MNRVYPGTWSCGSYPLCVYGVESKCVEPLEGGGGVKWSLELWLTSVVAYPKTACGAMCSCLPKHRINGRGPNCISKSSKSSHRPLGLVDPRGPRNTCISQRHDSEFQNHVFDPLVPPGSVLVVVRNLLGGVAKAPENIDGSSNPARLWTWNQVPDSASLVDPSILEHEGFICEHNALLDAKC